MIYPAYKTIKVIRKLEAPPMKLRLIKYWQVSHLNYSLCLSIVLGWYSSFWRSCSGTFRLCWFNLRCSKLSSLLCTPCSAFRSSSGRSLRITFALKRLSRGTRSLSSMRGSRWKACGAITAQTGSATSKRTWFPSLTCLVVSYPKLSKPSLNHSLKICWPRMKQPTIKAKPWSQPLISRTPLSNLLQIDWN